MIAQIVLLGGLGDVGSALIYYAIHLVLSLFFGFLGFLVLRNFNEGKFRNIFLPILITGLPFMTGDLIWEENRNISDWFLLSYLILMPLTLIISVYKEVQKNKSGK